MNEGTGSVISREVLAGRLNQIKRIVECSFDSSHEAPSDITRVSHEDKNILKQAL